MTSTKNTKKQSHQSLSLSAAASSSPWPPMAAGSKKAAVTLPTIPSFPPASDSRFTAKWWPASAALSRCWWPPEWPPDGSALRRWWPEDRLGSGSPTPSRLVPSPPTRSTRSHLEFFLERGSCRGCPASSSCCCCCCCCCLGGSGFSFPSGGSRCKSPAATLQEVRLCSLFMRSSCRWTIRPCLSF